MLVLTSAKNKKLKNENYLGVFDLEVEKFVLKFRLTDPEVIGRMKTNLYHFLGGHIYFNNRVIKVRYDLMSDPTLDMNEEIFFDHYSEVLHLKNSNDVIQPGSPLIACMYNRLAYVVENIVDLAPRTLVIMPYLHERKVLLNWRTTSDQFYTIS